MATPRALETREFTWAFVSYSAASFAHYAHNALQLSSYPNLPAWLSSTQIVSAWLLLAFFGVVGYRLSTNSRPRPSGFVVVAVYALLGFDGLAHYAAAPVAAHSLAMNSTIILECITAATLLVATVRTFRRTMPPNVRGAIERGVRHT